jgi:hypothetical protein
VLVDKTQAIELAGSEASNPLCHRVDGRIFWAFLTIARQVIQILQSDPHRAHWRYSRALSQTRFYGIAAHFARFSMFLVGFDESCVKTALTMWWRGLDLK